MQLEDYEEIKTIGKGSFGRAILVKRKKDGLLLVLKEINVMEMAPRERNDAMNEVHVLSMLDHRHIIGYYDSFLVNGTLYIVMEYANAGDIHLEIKKRTIQKKYFSEEEIWIWFTQICLAVQYINSKNILHRDLKTQNIFLSNISGGENGGGGGGLTVKLGDMGIAKILNSDTSFAKTVIGTPYYLSPEICEDRPYDHKSDIWSLGCVLYELATLKHAFNAGSLPALVMKILKGNYPPIPSIYSDNMKSLISFMLQTDPKKRPNIDDILSLPFLQSYILNSTTSSSSSSPPLTTTATATAATTSTNIPMSIIKSASTKTPTKQTPPTTKSTTISKPTTPISKSKSSIKTAATPPTSGSKLNHVKLKPPVPKPSTTTTTTTTPTSTPTTASKRTVASVTPTKATPTTPVSKSSKPVETSILPTPAPITQPIYTPPTRPSVSIQQTTTTTSNSNTNTTTTNTSGNRQTNLSSSSRTSSSGRLSIQPTNTPSSASTSTSTSTSTSNTPARRLSTPNISSLSSSSSSSTSSTSSTSTTTAPTRSTLNRQTSSSSLRMSSSGSGLTTLSSSSSSVSPAPPTTTSSSSFSSSGRVTPSSGRVTPSGRITPSGRVTPSTSSSSSTSNSNSRIISTPTLSSSSSSTIKSTKQTPTTASTTTIPIQTTPNIFNAPTYSKPSTPEIVLKKPTSSRQQKIDFKQQEMAYRQKMSSVKSTLQLKKDKQPTESNDNLTPPSIIANDNNNNTNSNIETDQSPSDQSETNSLENSGVESLDLNSDSSSSSSSQKEEEAAAQTNTTDSTTVNTKEKRNTTSPILRDKKLETRTNALRHFCCSIFGEDTFTTIYKLMKDIVCLNGNGGSTTDSNNNNNNNGNNFSDQQKEENIQQQIEQLLGDKIFYLKYLQQLLYCESQLHIL